MIWRPFLCAKIPRAIGVTYLVFNGVIEVHAKDCMIGNLSHTLHLLRIHAVGAHHCTHVVLASHNRKVLYATHVRDAHVPLL
jgi:hypothetical protein